MKTRFSKMQILSILSAIYFFVMAFACVIKDDTGRNRVIIPDATPVACDAKCGCATDGRATEWAYCMAHK